MKNKGIDAVVECGPGRVLSGLIKRIDNSLTAVSVNDKSSLELVFKQVIGRYEKEQL